MENLVKYDIHIAIWLKKKYDRVRGVRREGGGGDDGGGGDIDVAKKGRKLMEMKFFVEVVIR